MLCHDHWINLQLASCIYSLMTGRGKTWRAKFKNLNISGMKKAFSAR